VLLRRNGSQKVSSETGRTQKIYGVKDLWKVNFKPRAKKVWAMEGESGELAEKE